MVNMQAKLAQALRFIALELAQHRDANTPKNPVSYSLQTARDALAVHDESAEDAVNLLVMREALRDYASAEYVRGRDIRDGKGDAKGWGADTRERFAQGCDIRRRAALKMAEEIEG
jgi:hypothetical protein